MLSLVRLRHIIAHSVTSDGGEGSEHVSTAFSGNQRQNERENPENEEELQQGSHARFPGRGDDETGAHFRTESPTNLKSPQFIKANPGGEAQSPPRPSLSHFMPSRSFLSPEEGEL